MPFRATPITDSASASMAHHQPLSIATPKDRLKKGWLVTLLPSMLCGAALLSPPAHAQFLSVAPVVQSAAQSGVQTKQVDEAAPTETRPTEEAITEETSAEEGLSEEGATEEGTTTEEEPAEDRTTGFNPGANSGWQRFTSEEGAFSVSMPSQPAAYTFTPNTETSDTLTASSRMYMQMQLVSPHHLEIYAAAFIESAHLANAGSNLDAALLSCVSSLSDNGTLRTTPTPIAFGNHHGVEAEFLTPEGSLQVSRCYLAGDRAYMLTATSELFSAGTGLQPLTPAGHTAVRSPAMDTFFNSFKILN